MNKDFSCLQDPSNEEPMVMKDNCLNTDNGNKYPVIQGIPRFVDAENYSGAFGYQWNRFPKTQLDSFTGLDISESRLARCLQGNLTNIKGKKVLEAGSGAGRFTEVLLKYGAVVHSFDYSTAVEANAINNCDHENLILVQADIRKIPFPKESYDYVICLGVLQHTPNPEESIKKLWKMVKPGGFLVLDHYLWRWRFILPPPFGQSIPIYRFIILKLPRQLRFKIVKVLTDFWFPWHWKYKDSLFVQRILRRISPVIFHYPDIKLSNREAYYEWALLDTHDSTTDYYKHLRTSSQIKDVLEEVGAMEIVLEEGKGNGIEAFCRKKDK